MRVPIRPTDGFWPACRRVTKVVYTALLMGSLGYGAYALLDRNLDWWMRLVSLRGSELALVGGGAVVMMVLMEFMDRRLGRSVQAPWRWRLWGRNINFIPMDYAVLRVPFLALLYLNLPVLAFIEELVFRAGLTIWPQQTLWDALWRSTAFGYAHMLGGSTFGTCVPLVLGGLWFSLLFWYGGLPLATLGHLACNLIGLTLMLIFWARTGKNPFSA